MTGQQGAEALAPAVGKPLERVPTQTSDFTEDPSSPVDGRGEPLNLPQLDLTSSCQIWWDSAMCETLRLPSGYRKAAALLIKWCPSVCEFGQRGEQEMNQLKTVFEDSLNFETTIVPLTYDHHRSPELFLRDQVTKFLSKYNNPNDLLVVYVTSHASVHQEDQLLYLHPKRMDKQCPRGRHKARLSWNVVEETLMDKAKGDVLVILDACFAGNLQKAIAQRKLGRAYEFLGACEENRTTASPGPKSFTSTLIKSLSELAVDGPFTTSELLSSIQKNEDRQHNPPAHWRRSLDTLKYIQLARIPNTLERAVMTAEETAQYFGEDVTKYLNLRIELKGDEPPTQDQIEELARSVSRAVKQTSIRTGLPTRRVDCMGIESRSSKKSWRSVIGSVKQQIQVAKRFRAGSLNERHLENPMTTLSDVLAPFDKECDVSAKRPRGEESSDVADEPPSKRQVSDHGVSVVDFTENTIPITPHSDPEPETAP